MYFFQKKKGGGTLYPPKKIQLEKNVFCFQKFEKFSQLFKGYNLKY
jgi:hypothetical protein